MQDTRRTSSVLTCHPRIQARKNIYVGCIGIEKTVCSWDDPCARQNDTATKSAGGNENWNCPSPSARRSRFSANDACHRRRTVRNVHRQQWRYKNKRIVAFRFVLISLQCLTEHNRRNKVKKMKHLRCADLAVFFRPAVIANKKESRERERENDFTMVMNVGFTFSRLFQWSKCRKRLGNSGIHPCKHARVSKCLASD